jgi:hypothetical protein
MPQLIPESNRAEISASEEAMTYVDKTELVRERMLKAEEELRIYFLQAAFNLKKETQLSEAVKSARKDFVDNLELLCPRFPD